VANILVLGGGFGGIVAAEALAKKLGPEHQITLVSRSSEFIFYPALVRLAFGQCDLEDIAFDLRNAMIDRRIRFIEAEVARIDPYERNVIVAHGEVSGEMSYDYLICALGRRLATERVSGFYEHANHLLTPKAAIDFGEAVGRFRKGHAVIGYCPGSKLTIPVYETAFALSRLLHEELERDEAWITIVGPEPAGDPLGGPDMTLTLIDALNKHHIALVPDFPISHITEKEIFTKAGQRIGYDLLMLIPTFQGPSAVMNMGITDENGYIKVDHMMRVRDVDRMYAIGDCVNFEGPKMGHMAVLQAEVAVANLVAEIEGRKPETKYEHELMFIIDEGGENSIYFHKNLWDTDEPVIHRGRFWHWAKKVHERYWYRQHS
jgi:NADH dehydrogenase FAD-containing subunit